jgi:ABC-type proline/glycine betaine transport system permease subunit
MCHGREGRGSPLFDVVLRDTVTVADEDSLVDFILNSSGDQKARDAGLQQDTLPSALTWIFSSLHIGIGMAIVAVVVGEYLGASRGIGYLIAQAEGVLDTTGVFAGMAVLAGGVLLVGGLVSRVERRFLRWKVEQAESPSERYA